MYYQSSSKLSSFKLTPWHYRCFPLNLDLLEMVFIEKSKKQKNMHLQHFQQHAKYFFHCNKVSFVSLTKKNPQFEQNSGVDSLYLLCALAEVTALKLFCLMLKKSSQNFSHTNTMLGSRVWTWVYLLEIIRWRKTKNDGHDLNF